MKLSHKIFSEYLEEDEEILLIIHHHIFSVFKPILKIGILYILIPILAGYIFPNLKIIFVIINIFGILKIASILIAWYVNALIVSNLSFINVEWKNYFNRQSNRIEYGQIDNFSYNIIGVFNTLFNFGDVIIEKSNGNQVTIYGVFKPKTLTQTLSSIQASIIDTQLKQDHENLKNVLTNMLRSHINEHGIVVTED